MILNNSYFRYLKTATKLDTVPKKIAKTISAPKRVKSPEIDAGRTGIPFRKDSRNGVE